MSSNTADPALTLEMLPTIGFFGRSQEALDVYKAIFGGGYEVFRRDESGAIMFARFTAPGVSFAATDGGKRRHGRDVGNVALTLILSDDERAKQIFDALAEGGHIDTPLAAVPWGGQFGILFDRYDNEWLIVTQAARP